MRRYPHPHVGLTFLVALLLVTSACKGLGDRVDIASVRVVADTFYDGQLSSGEDAKIVIRMRNRAEEELDSLTVQISTSSPHITLPGGGGPVGCGSLAGGASVDCPPIDVTVSPQAQDGVKVRFSAAVRGDGGFTTLSFDLRINDPGPKPWIAQATVLNDTDGDGKLEPGETAQLQIALGNSGQTELAAPEVTLRDIEWSLDLPNPGPLPCGGAIPPGQTRVCEPWSIGVRTDFMSFPATAFLEVDVSANDRTYTLPLELQVVDESPILLLAGATLAQDDNADGILNPLETASLFISLYNDGLSPAIDVTLSSLLPPADTGLTVTAPAAVTCGTIAPHTTGTCDPVEVTAGAAPASEGSVPISGVAEDDTGIQWPFELQLPLLTTAGEVLFVSFSGVDPAPGETTDLTVLLRNVGTSRLDGVVLYVTADEGWGIEVLPAGAMLCGDLEPSAEVECPTLQVTKALDAKEGPVILGATALDASGAEWDVLLELPVPEAPSE